MKLKLATLLLPLAVMAQPAATRLTGESFSRTLGSDQWHYGAFTLALGTTRIAVSDLTLWRYSFGAGDNLYFSAEVLSFSGAARRNAEVAVTFTCDEGKKTVPFVIHRVGPGSLYAEGSPQEDTGACDSEMVSVSVVSAGTIETKAEFNSIPSEDQDSDKAAIAKAERAALLAKQPTLRNGAASSIFVGADRQCLQQFTVALASGGLTQRKALSELLAYGCGFLVSAGTHIFKDSASVDGATKVLILDEGEFWYKGGWVRSSWITPPPAAPTKQKGKATK